MSGLKNEHVIFTVVLFIIGFMLAVQFQSTKEPIIRDTRDIRELRMELRTEQERHQQLQIEIGKKLQLISEYEYSLTEQKENVEKVMERQIEELKEEAGLTEKTGEGIIITVKPLMDDHFSSQQRRGIPPELLRFLVNELNTYNAKDIAIGHQRLVSISAFRDVGGVTQVNGHRLPPLPIEIKVLAQDAEKLRNEMIVSESVEYFEIENLQLTIESSDSITLPAYDRTPRVRYMEEIKEEKKGD